MSRLVNHTVNAYLSLADRVSATSCRTRFESKRTSRSRTGSIAATDTFPSDCDEMNFIDVAFEALRCRSMLPDRNRASVSTSQLLTFRLWQLSSTSC